MIKRRIALFLALLMGVPLFSNLASAASEPSAVVETDLAAYESLEVLAMYKDGSYQVYSSETQDELVSCLETLAADKDVLLVQPNYTYSGQAVSVNEPLAGQQWALSNDGTFQVPGQQSRYPVYDDPFVLHFGRQNPTLGSAGAFSLAATSGSAVAGIDVNAQAAWDLYNGGQRSVVVAMIDTGVDYTHQDLSGAIWVNEDEIPGNGVDDDGNGYIDDVYGWNFYSNNNQVYTGSEDSHGTHGAGTIAASSDNQVGIAGIVPGDNVKIMPVKALGGSEGSGTTASLIAAIQYAEASGASICNLSLASNQDDRALYQAIANSKMLFIVAAGNDSANTDLSPTYPASYNLDNILSVANLSYNGTLHSTSNYGATSVDLAAPGTSILSTTPNNSYSYMTGTSMAAPMVTAAAAMVYTHFDRITLADVKEILLSSVKPLSSLTGLVSTGGMLDIGAALSYDTSSLSGASWTLPTGSSTAPTIEAQLFTQNGNLYVTLQVTDIDGDLAATAYAYGEHTASAFAGGTAGTAFSVNTDGTATFYVQQPGIYTFYAKDLAGNEVTKTVTLAL